MLYIYTVISNDENKLPILIIIGPSGTGKSFLVKHLVTNYPFELVLSTTTRPPRNGEVQNIDMNFVTDNEYKELQSEGKFFSDFENFGAKYGYLRSSVESIYTKGLIPVAIVYTTIVPYFEREFSGNVFSIFLYPTDLNLLESRMRHRGDSEESITSRIISCRKEILDYESHLSGNIDATIKISGDQDIYNAVGLIVDKYNLAHCTE